MKYLFSTLVLFIALALPAAAAERISNFDVMLELHEDSSLRVTESIEYEFGADERHGIYREIPISYKARGGNYKIQISDIIVTNGLGEELTTKVTTSGSYKRIRIGDSDSYVTGSQLYRISYTMERAINYFNDHDELYWNITGHGWDVPIDHAFAVVLLPGEINKESVQTTCYSGSLGSDYECSEPYRLLSTGSTITDVSFGEWYLSANEGLTFVLGLPKGLIYEPTRLEKILATVKDNGILVLPLLVIILMYYLWRSRGKDPMGRSTIIAQYNPPLRLTPAEVGTVVDERVNNHDISADIIYLATLGYIKITRHEEKVLLIKTTDYSLEKIRTSDSLSEIHLRKLHKALFKNAKSKTINGKAVVSINLSELKHKFHTDYQDIKKSIYESLVSHGYFPKNPQTVRLMYLVLGIGVIVLGFIIMGIFGALAGFSFDLSGLVIIAFSFFMSRKTKKGVLAYQHILGLKDYMAVAEKDRIKFHNAPEKDPKVFEQLLPFAMVLKVEEQWANQFKDIYNNPPSWYTDATGSGFNPIIFSTSLRSFSSTAGSTMASSVNTAASGGSGFSGGGFSGGGFGGGGGGSW